MKRARVLYEGQSTGGIVENGTVALEKGIRIAIDKANYLAPLEPRQIFATHLSYRSRCEEYKMKAAPKYPSYFVKAIGAVSHHNATVARPRGCRFLNYEGE